MGNSATITALKNLVRIYKPEILIVSDTRLSGNKVHDQALKLPFNRFLSVDARGYNGGMILLWNDFNIRIAHIVSVEQELHVDIQVSPNNPSWLRSTIYASPRLKDRIVLWDNLRTIVNAYVMPWLVLGDFNDVTAVHEKLRGNPTDLGFKVH